MIFFNFYVLIRKQTKELLRSTSPAYVISLAQINSYFKISALADVVQWIERQPVNQRITGLIPSQGTYLGCGPGPQ